MKNDEGGPPRAAISSAERAPALPPAPGELGGGGANNTGVAVGALAGSDARDAGSSDFPSASIRPQAGHWKTPKVSNTISFSRQRGQRRAMTTEVTLRAARSAMRHATRAFAGYAPACAAHRSA